MRVGWLAVDGDMVAGSGTAAATSLFGGCWRESKTQLWMFRYMSSSPMRRLLLLIFKLMKNIANLAGSNSNLQW